MPLCLRSSPVRARAWFRFRCSDLVPRTELVLSASCFAPLDLSYPLGVACLVKLLWELSICQPQSPVRGRPLQCTTQEQNCPYPFDRGVGGGCCSPDLANNNPPLLFPPNNNPPFRSSNNNVRSLQTVHRMLVIRFILGVSELWCSAGSGSWPATPPLGLPTSLELRSAHCHEMRQGPTLGRGPWSPGDLHSRAGM